MEYQVWQHSWSSSYSFVYISLNGYTLLCSTDDITCVFVEFCMTQLWLFDCVYFGVLADQYHLPTLKETLYTIPDVIVGCKRLLKQCI